jgi:hypothetical protein
LDEQKHAQAGASNGGQFVSGGGGGSNQPTKIKEHQKTPEQHAQAAKMPRTASSTQEAADVLTKAGVINKTLENKDLGIAGNISGKSLGEMISGRATKKSVSPGAHAHAIANADKLFERASIEGTEGDKNQNPAIENIHRLGSVMEYKGEIYPVKLTVKEYKDKNFKNKIYSIEAVDVERAKKEAQGTMTGHSVSASGTSVSAHGPSFTERLIDLAGKVKKNGGQANDSCPDPFDAALQRHVLLANSAQLVNPDRLTFDAASKRHIDENGFLHVAMSPISKETVNEYYGHEIPGWQEAGLDPQKIYNGYRPGPELEKAAPTFNGLNILSEHKKDDAEDSPKGLIIGSMGTDANYQAPYLRNSLIIKDAEAIKLLNPEDPSQTPKREISASYRYDPVFQPGVFNNQRYDFMMTNIRGNHIALVEEGRAGSDVLVSDEKPIERSKKMGITLKDILDFFKKGGVDLCFHVGNLDDKKVDITCWHPLHCHYRVYSTGGEYPS